MLINKVAGQELECAAPIGGVAGPSPEMASLWSDEFDVQLKTAGRVRPIRPTIVRGETDVSRVANCHLVDDDTVMAVETSNDGSTVHGGKRMIAAATHVDPDLLGDESVNLRNVLRDELKTTESP